MDSGNEEITKDEKQAPCVSKKIFVHPDGGYGWVVTAVCFLLNTSCDGIIYAIGLFRSALSAEFNESSQQVSWIGSLCVGLSMITGPLVSVVCDLYGSRLAVMIGAVFGGSGMMLSSFATSVNQMKWSFGIITGIALGFIYLPAVVFVSFYFEKRRSLVTGIVTSGSGMGIILLNPVTSILLIKYGWRITMRILAVIIYICFIWSLFLVPPPVMVIPCEFDDEIITKTPISLENRESELEKTDDENRKSAQININLNNAEIGDTASFIITGNVTNSIVEDELLITINDTANKPIERRRSVIDTFKHNISVSLDISLLKNPCYIMVIISNFFSFAGTFIPYSYVKETASHQKIPNVLIESIGPMMGLTNVIGRLVLGYVCCSPKVDALLINNLCLSLCAVSAAVFPYCKVSWHFLLVALCFGLGSAGINSLTALYLIDIFSIDKLTGSFGIVLFCRGLGAFAGLPAAGKVYDMTNEKYFKAHLPLYLTSVFFIISSTFNLFALLFKKYYIRKKRRIINE